MQSGWRVGSLFNIPLYVDRSWFLILALVTIVNAGDVSASLGQGSSNLVLAWTTGLFMALLLFGSVLLHELGHSLVARSQGIPVNSITLFIFGGIAAIDQESKTPGEAFQVAIAGPGVSLGLSAIAYAVAQVGFLPPLAESILFDLARINLILALFNLIPGLPLDGGQVVKAAVWKLTGNRFQGIHWAAKFGQILGWIAIICGAFALIVFQQFIGIWIALMGGFIARNASRYDRMSVLQETLVQLTAVEVMNREFRVIDGKMTLQQFAQEYILQNNPSHVYFAASEGRYRGQVRVEDLQTIERSLWESTCLEEIAHPLTEIPHVEENTPLSTIINRLETEQLPRITVLSPAGAVAGVIDRGDIVQAVGKNLKLAIPEGDIQRTKQEGQYPPRFQLAAIAKGISEDA